MRQPSRSNGIGTKEAALALVVILVCAAILIPIALHNQNKNLLLDESQRMRRIYAGFSFYGELSDGQPPLNLASTANYVSGKANFLSSRDPFADFKSDAYPSDPAIPGSPRSTFRVSFSYIESFFLAGEIKVQPWLNMQPDTSVGVLADEWLGSIQAGKPFEAQVSGRLLRINKDGSVFLLKDRGGPKPLGDIQDLFFRR